MESTSRRRRAHWLWVEVSESPDEPGQPESGRIEVAGDGNILEYWSNCHEDTHKGDLVLLYRRSPTAAIVELLEVTADAESADIELEAGEISMTQFVYMASASVAGDPLIQDLYCRFSATVEDGSDETEAVSQWEELVRAVFEQYGLPLDTVIVDDSLDGLWVCGWVVRHALAKPLGFREMKADPFLLDNWPALRSRFMTDDMLIPDDVWAHLVGLLRQRDPAFGAVVDRLGD